MAAKVGKSPSAAAFSMVFKSEVGGKSNFPNTWIELGPPGNLFIKASILVACTAGSIRFRGGETKPTKTCVGARDVYARSTYICVYHVAGPAGAMGHSRSRDESRESFLHCVADAIN